MVTSKGLEKRMVGAKMDLARKDVLNLSAIWQKVQEAIADEQTSIQITVDGSVVEGVMRYFVSYGLEVGTHEQRPGWMMLSWMLSE